MCSTNGTSAHAHSHGDCHHNDSSELHIHHDLSCDGAVDHCYYTTPENNTNEQSTRTIIGHENNHTVGAVDLEKGGHGVEHVVISVQGMTCTGCEKKLFRSMQKVPMLFNIKTNFLRSQAEFDVNDSTTSLDINDAIKQIGRVSGFACRKLNLRGHFLDLVTDDLTVDLANQDLPEGVISIVTTKKEGTSFRRLLQLDRRRQSKASRQYRVSYDPRAIGARDLLAMEMFRHTRLASLEERKPGNKSGSELNILLSKTILCIVLTIPVLVFSWAALPPHKIIYGAVCLVLATIIQVLVVGPLYISAFNTLRVTYMADMDLLIVLSSSIAYGYSTIAYGFMAAGKSLSTESFFETSTLLVTLVILGEYITALARVHAIKSISMEALQAPRATVLNTTTKDFIEIDARLLQYGDTFKALPDSSIVTDGLVWTGSSDVDESLLTGEVSLVPKTPGSKVIAGSHNHSGTLMVKLTHLPAENTIKKIGYMIEETKSSSNGLGNIADSFASYFVPVILAIAVLVFVIWVAIGLQRQKQTGSTSCINAMTYAVAALIVSCPCAIGLAVPMVLVIASGVAARHGIVVKSGQSMDLARKISRVVFDKTGTLTKGTLEVRDQQQSGDPDSHFPSVVLAITNNSKHPVSVAVQKFLSKKNIYPAEIQNLKVIPGFGIEATWEGKAVRAGSPYFVNAENDLFVASQQRLGYSLFCVTVDGSLLATYSLEDTLRPETISVITELHRRGVFISIVSGDSKYAVRAIADELSIPESHIRFQQRPEDKQDFVRNALAEEKDGVVLFCGDGMNDAIALAQASIGVHILSDRSIQSDMAQSAADVVLTRPNLCSILVLMDLSKDFHRRVVFNFVWSALYNVVAILLAAGAIPGARISPRYAGLGELVSVLPVILVGLGMSWVKFSSHDLR